MSQIDDFLDGKAAQPRQKSQIDTFLDAAPPPKRSIGAAVNDTVIEVANAAAGGVASAANFVKPGNAASKWIDENIVKAGEAKQSDAVKAEKQRLSSDLAAAEGVGDEVGAVGRFIVNNPVLSAAQAAGSFVGPGLAVKGATTAARAAGAGAKAVERAGRAAGVAAGAAMAGGDAAGTAYELASNAGATEDQAVAAGRQASVIPAIVGGAGGAFGAEKLLAGAKGFTGGTVARALKTGVSEAAQEGIEEGVTQYEGQRAAMPYDPTIDPSKGVAGAAAMGAALGGITGAGMGALDGLRQGGAMQGSALDSAIHANAGAEAFAAGQPMQPPVEIKSIAAKAQWVKGWQLAEAQARGQGQVPVGGAEAAGGGVQPGTVPLNPDMARIERDAADRLAALQQQEQGEPGVAQTTPPDGAAVLAQQRAQAEAQRLAAIEASRAVSSPDDEIYQSTGATAPRSVAMGLDPAAGPLSAGAALAVDTGAADQMQQAAALAQDAAEAQKQGKKPAEGNQKKDQQAIAPQALDPETGEILQGSPMQEWSDAELSNTFRGAQSREVRMQLALELGRRRALREQQELQAELDAEQRASVPGAERADAAFASLTEDAGPLDVASLAPASGPAATPGNDSQKTPEALDSKAPAAIKEVANVPSARQGVPHGPEATQAQQDRAQPAQGAAAPADPGPAANAEGRPGTGGAVSAPGVADGSATSANLGAKAAPAQGAQAPASRSPAQAKAIERVNAGKAYFFSEAKALGFVTDNGLADTHEVVRKNRSFHVVGKTSAPAAPTRAVRIAAILNSGGYVVGSQLRQGNGLALMKLTPEELAQVPKDAMRQPPTAEQMQAAATAGKSNPEPAGTPPDAGGPVTSLQTGEPDPRNSGPMSELDGFKPGDTVDVVGRTIGRSTVEVVYRRAMVGFEPVAMARIVGADGKKLDVLTSELTHAAVAEDSKPIKAAGPVDQALAAIKSEAEKSADGAEAAPLAPKKPGSATKQFEGNKVFTADAVAAARERMKKKLGTLNSGLDPELMMDGMTVAGAYIESGVRSFGQYAKAMIEDMGDGVKPYLLSFWEAARNYPGVDTKGMTSVEESAREHADLITPQVRQQAAEALGEEAPTPARRTKKTGVRGDMVLTQDWGVEHINGYGDTSRDEGNDTKDAFLKEARNYLNAVAAQLEQSGFAPHVGRNGKAEKPVSVSESGVAVSGDVSLTMQHPDSGTNVYVTIGGTAIAGMVPSTASGIAIMYRTATGSDRYAAKGGNTWAPVDLSATDLALLVSRAARSTIDKTSRAAGSTDTNDATNSGQNGRGADQGRAPEVSGRRGSSDDSAAPADSGNLEAGQPQDVPAPADAGRAGSDGVRVPGADVGGKRSTGEGGDAANGRTRTGRARAPDAGAGSRPSVKAPEEVSPANPGAGNFHIENPLEIVGGGQVARFDKNQAAIDLLNSIREESRQATAEEQRVLAGYTGWGSFGQELFQGTWEKPMPKDGWQARDKWLREHLGEDEWKSAQRSITNAHYTDPPTVTAMWDMAKRMGFTGGRVLEPSMGIGNFFGMMPADLKARSQLSGIELDSLTGAMAKLLYPDANVKIMGYQESKTPDDFHDVVIGNWPFENTTIADRRYNSLSPFLHDYFFLKAVDQVRPGGLVIGITSNGTMDKKATRIRAALAKKAELVSAIRLPSGAFQEYAGTKVVTDIVILRKREQPLSIVPSDPWINSVAYKTPAGPEVFINEYYVANPGNVIGTTDFGHGTTRMQPGMIVHRPENMAERLRAAVELVPEGAYKKAERAKHITYITNHTADREGALTLQDGQLMVVRGEHLAPAEQVRSYKVKSAAATAQREKELRALIDMRGKYAALIEADRGGADATAQRTALREAYEAFTTEHGPLGDSFGLNYLKRIDDPFRPALAALEVNGRPSAILTGSTMRGAARMENPSAQDAYVLARNTAVEPTIEEIAALAKKPADQVKAALLQSGAIFETPAGAIVPSDIYLSGNVREKLRQAQAALEDGNQAMQRNVDELAKVVPKDIPYFNIESQLGATWVPPKTYAAYVAHMLNMPDGDSIGVTFINGRWKVKLPDGANRRAEASTGFGTSYYPFSKLVNAAMSNQTVKIRRKDSSGNEYLDTEATDEANGKISDIRAKYGEWLWSDPERRVAQEREYNEVRNAYATPKYDGSFLAFEGMALSVGRGPFNLREHQVNAIWRALVNRRSLNGHEVGTGKTFTMGGIAVESRRYGIAKKPMILAHNANSASVAAEIQQMYPGAKLLYIDNLTPDTIAVKMRQIANDDWDAIVVPHSLIDRLSFREETLMAMAQEDIRSLEEEAYAAAEDDGVTITKEMLENDDELKKLRSVTAKELVKARNRIIESIKDQAMRSSKEGAIPFEELGIDMVLVDEVHEFKKPPISTRMNMKGLNTQTSNRSIALQFITRYIRANNNGGNVHTFTGTPITNTLTEIFHQMRYVMEDEMKAAGVDTWDGWFGSFAKEVQDVELSAAGEYEAVTRLAGFINVPELRRMIGQYMDVVFADDMPEMQPRRVNGKTMASADLTEAERADLLNGRTEGAMDRPYKKVINVTSDLTPEQTTIFARLQGYARTWRSMTGKQRKEAMAAGAPESPIITEGMANKASFDVRLTRDDEFAGQEGTAPDDPGSKASKVIANVLEIYRSSPDAAQVIFAEQGYSTSQKRSIGRDAAGNKQYRTVKTFSTMRDIVARLVSQGIPAEQIAMVDGSTSKEKRKEIADAMNALRIRVVIGSTDTLGVGVNMQRNLRAMHHMDAPYMPGELEQRNGRGLRQGNQWNTVLEYRYMTDRLDGRRWQILAVKQRFITAFLKSNSATRVIEGDAAADEDSDILQSFAEAAGDPRILIREKLSKNVEALKRAERLHTNGVADAKQAIRRTNDSVAWARKRLADMTANNLPGRVRELLQSQAANYRATVDGTQYDSRAEAEDAMQQSLQDNVRMENVNVPMGTYGGQTVTASWPALQNTPHLTITMGNQEFTSTSLRGLEAQLRGLPGRIEKVEQEIASKAGSISRMEEVAAAPFARAADLERAKKQFDALVADIAANPVPPPAWLRAGAPVESAAFRNGKEFLVTGHRWNADGWFVLAQDAKGEVAIPYDEVTDAQGMPVYEKRQFEVPEVHTKEPKGAASTTAPTDQGDTPVFRREDDGSAKPFDVNAFLGVMGRSAAFSDSAQRQAIESVSATVDAIRAAWGSNAPEVVVAFDMQDERIPEAARRADLRQRSGGARGAPEGFYYRGKAYLMASRLNTPQDAARVLFHEVLGHHGLRGKFGRELDQVLNQVATMRKAEVAAKMREYGLRGVNGLSVREAAEEVLAEMAEKNPKLHFVQRAVAAIRNFLRAHVPGLRNLRMTDNDIIQAYILPARGWVERGGVDLEGGAAPEWGVNFARHPGFSAAVDAAVKAGTMGESGGRAYVEIGTLPSALAAAGVPAGELKTSAKVLQKVVFDHGVPPSVLKRIPELLERPVMVFRSATVDGRFVAVTSEMVRGAPLIVAISPETTPGAVALNFVPSLYPRDDLQAIQRWLNATKPGEQLLTYLDKEQSPAWFGSTRLQLPGEFRTTQGLQSRSVKTQADVVNMTGVGGDEPVFSRSRVQEMKASALEQLHQALSHPGKVSLWDKTVGTMRNLAERSPAFKPVYEAAQRFIDDVSMLGNDAADRAPRLLPRVETLADLKKKPITAADNQAVATPLFEGTLLWARDEDGTPVTTEALNAKYRNATPDEKAQVLLRTGKIQAQMLKMWRGLPVEQYNTIINNKFESTILKPGVAWSAKELKNLFGLNDLQVSLYQEARAAIDRSIDMTARADMLRALGSNYAGMRDLVLEQANLTDAMRLLTDTLQADARENPDQAERLLGLNNAVVKSYERAQELQQAGYAPLSRFGRYTVDVVDAAGERQYFGMFETMREANMMRIRMASTFPGATVTAGTMSQEAFKLFQGITPESLEHFGEMLGLSGEGSDAKDKAFQAYLQLAKNNHSALKRLIHRKGISGYSEDVGRVLASFVYSNARLAAGGLNAGTLETAIEGIPKEQGELRDVAMGLRSYIQDPQEEGQAVRGMLFAQYLGGSVASALVNMTQPFQITMPWLSQFGGMRRAGVQLAAAVRDMARGGRGYEADLAHALRAAEDDGVVSPQEIHQLMAQARGTGSLRTGDGTRVGDARAAAANNWERVKVAWGQPFALAEQFNRRSTFIAAYRLAKEQGMDAPAEFARRAVLETQFVYSKANKPEWARGAIGGTLFTFKTYSVSYLELMHRMWNQGGPEGKRAVGWALAMLLLMGGAGGLPFMEDAEDLIDGVGQLMGYNMSTKHWRKQALRDLLGKELADFIEQGVSGLPGAPIDVSGRLGMGNLIPGTGLLLSKQSRERDLLELAGPAGDLVARGFTGARKLLTGDVGGAALEVSPTAVRNAFKGADMAASGIYKDTKGYKVIDTTLDEAVAKFVGFQPRSVAQVQESNSFMQRSKSFYIQTSSDIKAQWAQALFEKDDAALERVRERLADWNRNNPEQPIVVKMPDVWKRVREMGKDRIQRIEDTAPNALRNQMREMAREAG